MPPHILSLPREIRDEIYNHNLHEPLSTSLPQPSRSRKRVRYSASDPETHFGEETVLYPVSTPLPPSHGLLQTCRQIRAEVLNCIGRMGPMRYKIDLARRDEESLMLYPTWVSIPAFAKHIDVLEVQLRLGLGKTTSVTSVSDAESGYPESDNDVFCGGLALLQRFLERGVYFLSKKKREKISVGKLAVHVHVPKELEKEMEDRAKEIADVLDKWMRGGLEPYGGESEGEGERREREDGQFRIFAGRVERVELSLVGKLERTWVLQEMLEVREKLQMEKKEERQRREAGEAAEVAEAGSGESTA